MMSRVGRARERSETDGFIKILVDADSEEILGAAILGIEGDEAVHTLLAAMYAKAPYTVISRAVHIHRREAPAHCSPGPAAAGLVSSAAS